MHLSYVVHVNASQDDLLSLAQFLSQESELRGRVTPVPAVPVRGQMGSVTDVIQIAVGSGGALAVMTSAITAWLKNRGSDITIRVSGPGGRCIEMAGRRLRSASMSDTDELVRQWTRELGRPSQSGE